MGLQYNLLGALAHRNAFYDLTGGDARNGSFAYALLVRDLSLAPNVGARGGLPLAPAAQKTKR